MFTFFRNRVLFLKFKVQIDRGIRGWFLFLIMVATLQPYTFRINVNIYIAFENAGVFSRRINAYNDSMIDT